MIELTGKFNTAKVFTDNIEEGTISQVINLCNQEFTKDSKIRIMPDCHQGVGCVIGTTMSIIDKVVPNLVGVDIGCGMLLVDLGNGKLDLPDLDNFIRNNIPHGHNNNKEPIVQYGAEINKLLCIRELNKIAKDFTLAIGSLGGGNHFIEINISSVNKQFLVIHSGSRNMGLQIAKYYQDRAFDYHNGIDDSYEEDKFLLIAEYKETNKRNQIQSALEQLKKKHKRTSVIPKDFCYLTGQLMESYLYDMNIAQKYALLNRETMARRIVTEYLGLDYDNLYKFQTIHNYIDMSTKILRKGAVSAEKDEILLIPINMKDGSLICRGKGNSDWNYSAPHGAGRLMSRSQAKEVFKLEEFKNTMKGIYTTSVNKNTIDESPMVYKPMQEIIDNIQDTVEVLDQIKPIYNFKAGE